MSLSAAGPWKSTWHAEVHEFFAVGLTKSCSQAEVVKESTRCPTVCRLYSGARGSVAAGCLEH